MLFKNKKSTEPSKKKVTVSLGGGRKERKRTQEKINLEELEISKSELKRVITKGDKVKGGSKDIKYSLYKSSEYGKIANRFFENLTLYFGEKFPQMMAFLNKSLQSSGIPILSHTFMSIVILSSLIAFFGVLLIVFVVSFFLTESIPIIILRSVGFAFLALIGTFIFVYFYPSMVVGNRRKAIKNDLPFVIIHMAAVAGSGAQPISIFNLVLNTGEYKGLEKEIKKIVNYVNLFGYDLSSALRTVAGTTPSPEFRELLNGIVATLETGGSLKEYLQSKADDAFTTYKLVRKKYVESVSTYSDIYTSILIAAPLLFLVTVAIINILGGKIGPFESKDLAFFGTFIIIPFLNIAFIVFINMIQPGE